MGPFDVDGSSVGAGDIVGVAEVGGGVWVGVGVGGEPLKGAKLDKENAKAPTTSTAKTKTATATYRFFILRHKYTCKFIS